MNGSAIERVHGRTILDSRGRPTVEVDVVLRGGATGRAAVPSGASTGTAEAHELRDGDRARFGGYGVTRAVASVNGEIASLLRGLPADGQRTIDERLTALDGTPQLRRLGANAVLGASLAVARAAAAAQHLPLYAYIAQLATEAGASRGVPVMPLPMVNILSGGLHARHAMDVQDFLAIPLGARTFAEALHTVWSIRASAATLMERRDLSVLLADEGGLSPGFADLREALDLMVEAITAAGLEPGRDAAIALDMAASGLLRDDGRYHFARAQRAYSSDEVIELVASWVAAYPIVSVEDPLSEEDWSGWQRFTRRFPRLQIVGDDLFATNPSRIARGVRDAAANCALIKLNQNGTLTGTLAAMAEARRGGFGTVVSARSGETEDPFIADLAVGTASGQIKIGSLRSSERLSKYNQLLRLTEEVGDTLARDVLSRSQGISGAIDTAV